MPCPQGRPRVLTVVSSVGPEIDQHHSPAVADLGNRGRLSVQPPLRVLQFVIGSGVNRGILLHGHSGQDLLSPIRGLSCGWRDRGGRRLSRGRQRRRGRSRRRRHSCGRLRCGRCGHSCDLSAVTFFGSAADNCQGEHYRRCSQ